jgi:multicomponent Na+:H+ antiporter subunit E
MIMLIFLFLLWLVLNGRGTLEICIIGAVLALAVYLLAVFALGFSPRHEKRLWKRLGLYIAYTAVLIWEIIKASCAVMKIILMPHPNYHPAIVKVRIPLKKQISRVILANSITLTAGTITVEEKDGEFTVLCLDKPSANGLANWSLVRILKKLEEPEWN